MMKSLLVAALFVSGSAAVAQTAEQLKMNAIATTACPSNAPYATIRHNSIMPGKWAVFQQAVADHQAWYAKHGDKTTNKIGRMVEARNGGAVLSEAEAITITQYSGKPQPAHDAAYEAFTAKYRASAVIKDEMRVCLPK
jgi:hypothetical protein